MTNDFAIAEIDGKEVFVSYNDTVLSIHIKQGLFKKNLKELYSIPILNLLNADINDHKIIIKNQDLELSISFRDPTKIEDIRKLIAPINNSIDSLKNMKVLLENFFETYVDLVIILKDIKADPINTAINFPEDQALKLGINKFNANDILLKYIEILNAKIDEINALTIEVDTRILDKTKSILQDCKQYLERLVVGIENIKIDKSTTKDQLLKSFKNDFEKLCILKF